MQSNILQAYKDAIKISTDKLGTQAEVEAYKKVIEIANIQNINDKKSQILSDWAYNKIGDAFFRKKSPNEWLKNKLERIAILPLEQKRSALKNLADNCADEQWKILIYEKALTFTTDENVSFEEKCKNTMDICIILEKFYSNNNDPNNWARINNLLNKTADLLVNYIESCLDNEEDSKKRELLVNLLEIQEKYIPDDITRKKCLFRRLNLVLKEQENIYANNKIYNKHNIKDFLRKNAL